MPGYLLDTNHVDAYFDEDPKFVARLRTAPHESLFWISAITIGEIEASYGITNRSFEAVQRSRRLIRESFLSGPDENLLCLPIDETSRSYYASVIERLWGKYPPRNHHVDTEKHLAATCGIDINDVWIFATAWKHGLTLLTRDRMERIRELVSEVNVENWLETSGAVSAIEPEPPSSQSASSSGK